LYAALTKLTEEIAMKAASLFVAGAAVAILSIAPANAESKYLATTTGNCSTTSDIVSPVQCTKPVARNYVECTEMVRKNGSRASDAWWWCSNQGFKN
jgi:hypothetical protein